MKKSIQIINQRGFTLIELLVVIAILGVLATVVLAAINPIEQLKRGRDASRIAAITQLGHAIANYQTSQGGGTILTAAAGWQSTAVTNLKGVGEISQAFTDQSSAGQACPNGNVESNYCYSTSGTTGFVYVAVESKSYISKYNATNSAASCTANNGGVGTKYVVFMYDTSLGKGVITCVDSTAAAVSSSISVAGVTYNPVNF